MTDPQFELGELMARRQGTVDPSNHPNETFHLFSIPAFDNREPEILSGADIGSAKKTVEPGDVLLSRIVPHIRRAWVVPEKKGKRQIASTEWIVFRGNQFFAPYLCHFLTSDQFHIQFMNTVAGVGGSLLRARPDHVAKIHVPLPKMEEQKRIAAILDKADAIRRQRHEALNELTSLPGSVFCEWFGDPVTNSRNFPMVELREVISLTGGFAFRSEDYRSDGIPLIRIGNANNNKFNEDALVYLPEEYMDEFARYLLRPGDMIMTLTGTVGKDDYANIVEIPDNYDQWFLNQRVARVALTDERLIKQYLIQFLMTPHVKNLIRRMDRGVRQANLRNEDILSQQIPVPPRNLQTQFASAINQYEKLRRNMVCEQQVSNDLFNSLVQRAFKGEL